MRKLKLWNGGACDCKGHFYVAAHSQKDCCDLVNEAYRKMNGYEGRPDISPCSLHEIQTMWSPNCWVNAMAGVTPERGVWYRDDDNQPSLPRRIL